jgi:hypothetical protein
VNLWECQHPGCKSTASGCGGAAGLIAIGWYFTPGYALFCPFHRPDPQTCEENPKDRPDPRPCSLCRAENVADAWQAQINLTHGFRFEHLSRAHFLARLHEPPPVTYEAGPVGALLEDEGAITAAGYMGQDRREAADRHALDLTVACPAIDCLAPQGEPCRGEDPRLVVHLGRRIRRIARARGLSDDEVAQRIADYAAGKPVPPLRDG